MTNDEDGNQPARFRAGDVVEVLSAEDILSTLDESGALERLPFMPEMLRYCGQRLTVVKRADKACTGRDGTIRRVRGAVHLDEVRCDGSAHGGCEASCLLYWKEEWLKPAEPRSRPNLTVHKNGKTGPGKLKVAPWNTVDDLVRNAKEPCQGKPGAGYSFRCQATAIPDFGCFLSPWDVRQYVRDVHSGNVRPIELLSGLALAAVRKIEFTFLARWKFRETIPMRTPSSQPEFSSGELVEIRPAPEIEATLDRRGRNRGLAFTPEMRELCGRQFRVLRRIHKIIDERTGRMVQLARGCLILDGAICPGNWHRFCPRMAHLYWRDIWLRAVRVSKPASVTEISSTRAPRQAAAITSIAPSSVANS